MPLCSSHAPSNNLRASYFQARRAVQDSISPARTISVERLMLWMLVCLAQAPIAEATDDVLGHWVVSREVLSGEQLQSCRELKCWVSGTL